MLDGVGMHHRPLVIDIMVRRTPTEEAPLCPTEATSGDRLRQEQARLIALRARLLHNPTDAVVGHAARRSAPRLGRWGGAQGMRGP